MTDTQNYIITELLGDSLWVILKDNDKPFSLDTVGHIGLQLLDRLEYFHNIGYIHCDLKPDNILIGSNEKNSAKSRKLYLIDFGVSKWYRNQSGQHVPF